MHKNIFSVPIQGVLDSGSEIADRLYASELRSETACQGHDVQVIHESLAKP